MTTFISIDRGSSKNWDPQDPEGALAYLNKLLLRHAVKLELLSPPNDPALRLKACVIPYEAWRVAMKRQGL